MKPFLTMIVGLGLAGALASCVALRTGGTAGTRQTILLDGEWQVAEGSLAKIPKTFEHTVPVPGLLDLATPRFEAPGTTFPIAESLKFKSWLKPADPRREAFWYRRTFRLAGPLPAVAQLKINKACYGTQVFINGQVAGEHGPNFTPGWFDVRPFLKGDGAENEIIIRLGASLAQVPDHLTDGWDCEKCRYIPGIYDSASLILCGTPHIVNVQTVPDVERHAVRAVIELASPATKPIQVTVREAKSSRIVGAATGKAQAGNNVDMNVAIRDAHLWTPEDPFLYELQVDTGGDTSCTRFGLRTFSTDPMTGRALLNGKPYFLRGSNVCIFRFFEDAARGNLPWDREWVRTLHQRFKEMHWNSLRYCIGFPPELWYEIADEEGILIQDEFPIWHAQWPAAITAEHLAGEFTEWLRERWNHPCVAIWDAQNETTHDEVTGAALTAVRDLDLSHRPWDNGWGAPQRPGDVSECHSYRANRKYFTLPHFAVETGIPDSGPGRGTRPFINKAKPPYLINEYGWLWLNRDGSPTTLTADVYKRLLGTNTTVEERRHYYARTLAAKTEFWRGRRQCAGVLHFCGLGYSRPDGQTSDNWLDVRKLAWEPNFRICVRDAFAPVGIMIDAWAETYPAGQTHAFPVQVINDLYADWKGTVLCRLWFDGKSIQESTQPCEVAALGIKKLAFTINIPEQPGAYTIEASLLKPGTEPVSSLRDFKVVSEEQKR